MWIFYITLTSANVHYTKTKSALIEIINIQLYTLHQGIFMQFLQIYCAISLALFAFVLWELAPYRLSVYYKDLSELALLWLDYHPSLTRFGNIVAILIMLPGFLIVLLLFTLLRLFFTGD